MPHCFRRRGQPPGKILRDSFDNFRDRAAAQVLSAFATDTALVLARIDIAEKSNEIPAAQRWLAELGLADGALVTMDALHCQKKPSRARRGQYWVSSALAPASINYPARRELPPSCRRQDADHCEGTGEDM